MQRQKARQSAQLQPASEMVISVERQPVIIAAEGFIT